MPRGKTRALRQHCTISVEQGYMCRDVSSTNVSEVYRIASSMNTAGSGKVFLTVARVGFARHSFVSYEI